MRNGGDRAALPASSATTTLTRWHSHQALPLRIQLRLQSGKNLAGGDRLAGALVLLPSGLTTHVKARRLRLCRRTAVAHNSSVTRASMQWRPPRQNPRNPQKTQRHDPRSLLGRTSSATTTRIARRARVAALTAGSPDSTTFLSIKFIGIAVRLIGTAVGEVPDQRPTNSVWTVLVIGSTKASARPLRVPSCATR